MNDAFEKHEAVAEATEERAAEKEKNEETIKDAKEAQVAVSQHPKDVQVPRLVLGWINADFRVQIRILQHFSRSTINSSSRQKCLHISCNSFNFFSKS